MYLSRRFAPAVTVISLLIALSILAVISFGKSFRNVVFREAWLKSTATNWKREDAGSLFQSYPWNWQSSAEGTKDSVKDTSNDVVTVTVCTPADTLPTTATNPLGTVPTVPQNSTGPPNGGLTNTGSSNTASFLGASACNNPTSTLSACGLLPTSAGYVCQYYPPTVYPTDCSECVKTSTVTNTYLSTVSDCNATQFSFIAAFTVTVTANLSASAVIRATNRSLAITSARSTPASQGFSLLPTGNVSSSAIICSNGTLAKRQQGCIPLLATPTQTFPSVAATNSTTLGLVLSSPRSSATSQTLSRSPPNSSNLANVTTSALGSITTGILSNFTTGGSSATAMSPSGGSSASNSTFGIVTYANQVSGTVAPITTSIQGLPSDLSNFNTVLSVSLLSALPVGNIVLPTISTSTNLATASLPSVGSSLQDSISIAVNSVGSVASSGLPTVTSVPSLVSSTPSNFNSIASSTFPVVTSVPPVIFSAFNPVNSIKSSSLRVVSTPEGLISNIASVATGIISSALPVATSVQVIVSSALGNINSVTTPVLPFVTPVQGLVSSLLSEITGIAGSVLPIVAAIPSSENSVLSNVNSVITSVLAPVTPIQSITTSIVSDVTAIVGPVATLVPSVISGILSNINSVASSVLRPITPVQSLIPSIVSDITAIVGSVIPSVLPVISAVPSNVNPVAPSVLPIATPVQGLIPGILSDATAIVLPVISPVVSTANAFFTNVIPVTGSALTPVLSVPVLGSGALTNAIPAVSSVLSPVLSAPGVGNTGGELVSSILRPITSAVIPAVVNIANAVPNLVQGLGGNLHKETVELAVTGMSTATTVKNPVKSENPGVVTVTHAVSVVTVFVPTPLTTSMLLAHR